MGETLTVLKTRRSCRSYQDTPVPKETVEKILEAGTYAATGKGRQAPIIIAVMKKELRDRLSELNRRFRRSDIDPFYGAPQVLVVLADRSVETYLYDGSCVMANMMNAASDLGVASCWIHRAKEVFDIPEGKEILKELGITGDYEGIGNLVIGYAKGDLKEAAPRKADYIYWA